MQGIVGHQRKTGPLRGTIALAIPQEAGGGRRLVRDQGTPPMGEILVEDKFGAFIVSSWDTVEISAPNL
jgi:hypothetical protein